MIQMDLEEIENALLGLDTMYESKKVIEKAKDLIIPNKKKVLAKAN
jgi:chaperonin cofactor prefoldin